MSALRKPLIVCGSGKFNNTSSVRQPKVSTTRCALPANAAWLSTTIFGVPVEPDVHR